MQRQIVMAETKVCGVAGAISLLVSFSLVSEGLVAWPFFLSSQRLFLPSVPFEEGGLFSDWKAKRDWW